MLTCYPAWNHRQAKGGDDHATRGNGHAQEVQRRDGDGRRGAELVKGRRLNNNDEEIRNFFDELDDEVRVVLEAGPSWHWMCNLLDELKIDNRLCHPLKTRAIASARIKTDKLDSAILSHLDRMDFMP